MNFFGITVSLWGKRIGIIRGSLVRQLPSYGRWSWLAFTPSCQPNHCQPHHHVNPIIKKLGSVVVRSVWTHGWKHSRARNLAVFSRNVALEVAQVEFSASAVHSSIWKSCRQRAHRTVARARFALQKAKSLSRSGHFWKMRSAKCAPVHERELGFTKIGWKNWQPQTRL